MQSLPSTHPRSGLISAAALLGLLLGLAATGYTFVHRSGFNEDEFFQLTFLNEGLPQFFSLFLRLDQHPPFHFLQLIPWAAVSTGDGWMLFNSVAWHGVSCLVIWAVGRAWLGSTAGLLAAALYALMPQVVSASTTLRFYAMLPALVVLVWWLHVRLLSRTPHRARWWWALVVLQVAFTYSHAIAFYFVFWIALAAAVQQRAEVGADAPWRRWLMVQAGVLVLLLPQVGLTAARALMARGTGDMIGGNNDPGGLIDHFGGMTAGWGMQWAWARVAGTGVFVGALLVGLSHTTTRRMVVIMLIGPYALAVLIGMVLTPMFKTPVYSSVLLPFACLGLAGGLARPGGWWRPAVAVGLLAAMAAFIFPASAHLNRGVSPYRPLVAELKRVAQPGDVVVVPTPYLYWAVMRYAVGPYWGSPLAVLPALNGSWLKLTDRLGPTVSQALKLIPVTNEVDHGGIRYVIGDDAITASRDASRVWLVYRTGDERPVGLAPGLADQGVVFQTGRPEVTQIRLFAR